MYVSEIVIRQNGDGPPRRVRIRRRAPPPKPAEQLDPDYVDPAEEEEYDRQVRESGVSFFLYPKDFVFVSVFKET